VLQPPRAGAVRARGGPNAGWLPARVPSKAPAPPGRSPGNDQATGTARPSAVPVGAEHDPQEREADAVAEGVMAGWGTRGPAGLGAPVEAGRLGGAARRWLEPRLGADLGDVRIHTGHAAEASAAALGAAGYTLGNEIVLSSEAGEPASAAGMRVLAHELAHVAQHRRSPGRAVIRRTPASKVSCAPGPLHVPAATPFDVADPVAVITAAETEANRLLDAAIGSLDFTRNRILGGASVGWPTVPDSLGRALQILGLDPDREQFWRGSGQHTAELLLRRLRMVRPTIGGGGFFFRCLGPSRGKIGSCEGELCSGAGAVSCGGSFLIFLCVPFWEWNPAQQADAILHESFHNFAFFIQDRAREREGIAACYARFVETAAGLDDTSQRVDLCGDPA
jgi:hypothetical protein